MNTHEILRRLLRFTTQSDISQLPLTLRLELVDVINAAINRFYEDAPSKYRRTTVSVTLSGPQAVSVAISSGNNKVDSGTPFTESQRGDTIVFADDEQYNEIVSTTSVLDTYQGSGGVVDATIYDDAIPFLDRTIQRVVDNPRLNTGETLYRDDTFAIDGYYGGIIRRGSDSNRMSSRNVGRPCRYTIDLVGHSQSGSEEPVCILRVDPMPDTEYRLRVDVDLAPARITLSDLVTPKILPMPDWMMEQMVIPYAGAQLVGSEFWNPQRDPSRILQDEQRAIMAARNLTQELALPRHRCGTRRGY